MAINAFTAFTAFHPADHKTRQSEGHLLLWRRDIRALPAQIKAVKPVKAVPDRLRFRVCGV